MGEQLLASGVVEPRIYDLAVKNIVFTSWALENIMSCEAVIDFWSLHNWK
jgi:hypothetical protein